jgi:hypothetical protein
MNLMHRMLPRWRANFERLNVRERFLVSLFLAGLGIWWALEWVGGLSRSWEQASIAARELEAQQVWLDRESDFDQRMEQALQKMDASLTYSGNRLLEVIDAIAREVGLQTSISRPSTRAGRVFTEHVLIIPLNRAELKTLIEFENRIKQLYPYLGVDYLMIEPEPMQPELLRGEMRVTSFELNSDRR